MTYNCSSNLVLILMWSLASYKCHFMNLLKSWLFLFLFRQHMRDCILNQSQLFQDLLSYNLSLIKCSDFSTDEEIRVAASNYILCTVCFCILTIYDCIITMIENEFLALNIISYYSWKYCTWKQKCKCRLFVFIHR